MGRASKVGGLIAIGGLIAKRGGEVEAGFAA
jgi:hypothetical protein